MKRRETLELAEPLPFATKDGYWNGDMLHDWLNGEAPSNKNHLKIYATIKAIQADAYKQGAEDYKRKIEKVEL